MTSHRIRAVVDVEIALACAFLTLITAFLCAFASLRESPKDPELRKELLKRVKDDQDARNAWIEFMKKQSAKSGGDPKKLPEAIAKLKRVDAANVAWLKKVVAKRGWLGKTLVGQDGAHNAWLLVQHADEDRPFQKQCLALLEAAVKTGEARGDDLAYLTDRVLVGEGKPQRYGTQTKLINGEIKMDPVEDEPNLDKRRTELGMMPIAEYLKVVREMYLGKKK